jgi:chromosome segregation ATPase
MSTDDHFSRLLVQDEKNLKRLWADIEANRTHCDKHYETLRETLGEEEHSRKGAVQALRSSLDFLQQELAHSKQELSDAIDKEAQSRETADAAMLAAAAALREDTETVHHALGRQIILLAENLAGELGAMKQVAMEASAGHVKRSAANKESIQAIDKQMDALVDRLACTQALLEDVQYTSAKTLVQRSLPLCSRPLWT